MIRDSKYRNFLVFSVKSNKKPVHKTFLCGTSNWMSHMSTFRTLQRLLQISGNVPEKLLFSFFLNFGNEFCSSTICYFFYLEKFHFTQIFYVVLTSKAAISESGSATYSFENPPIALALYCIFIPGLITLIIIFSLFPQLSMVVDYNFLPIERTTKIIANKILRLTI